MYALWVHARDVNNQTQADALLARCKSAGITDVFFQLLDDSGRAHYNASPPFTKCPDVGTFDPLGYLAARIKTHAWLCVGLDVLRAHPEWCVHITRGLSTTYPSWADFTRADVRAFAANWCASIAQAYPTVGIHLDYMRWHTDFGDAKLSWATAAPITQTVQQIAAALPSSAVFTIAVSSDPTGKLFGNLQAWGEWTDLVDRFVIMAYPSGLSNLQSQMARVAAYGKEQIVVGLSGLYFSYNPYRETRLTSDVLVSLVNWAREHGYDHFAWFDYTKITAEQYATIAQLAPPSNADNLAEIVKSLTDLATALRGQADNLDVEASELAEQSDDLRTESERMIARGIVLRARADDAEALIAAVGDLVGV